jgi:hypothetical protein
MLAVIFVGVRARLDFDFMIGDAPTNRRVIQYDPEAEVDGDGWTSGTGACASEFTYQRNINLSAGQGGPLSKHLMQIDAVETRTFPQFPCASTLFEDVEDARSYIGHAIWSLYEAPNEIVVSVDGVPVAFRGPDMVVILDVNPNATERNMMARIDEKTFAGRAATVGRIIYPAGVCDSFVKWPSKDRVGTVIHEVFHVMGFSLSYFEEWVDKRTGKPYGANFPLYHHDGGRMMLATPEARAFGENYFGSATFIGTVTLWRSDVDSAVAAYAAAHEGVLPGRDVLLKLTSVRGAGYSRFLDYACYAPTGDEAVDPSGGIDVRCVLPMGIPLTFYPADGTFGSHPDCILMPDLMISVLVSGKVATDVSAAIITDTGYFDYNLSFVAYSPFAYGPMRGLPRIPELVNGDQQALLPYGAKCDGSSFMSLSWDLRVVGECHAINCDVHRNHPNCKDPYYRPANSTIVGSLPGFRFGFVRPFEHAVPCNEPSHLNLKGYGTRGPSSFLYLAAGQPTSLGSGVCLNTTCLTEGGSPALVLTASSGERQICKFANEIVAFRGERKLVCHDPVYVCNLLIVESATHREDSYAFPPLFVPAPRPEVAPEHVNL